MKKSIFYISAIIVFSSDFVFANICQKYLTPSKVNFLEVTSDKLIALQLEVYEEQQALVHNVHLSLKELSVPRRESGQIVKTVTHVQSATLNLMGQWTELDKDSPWRINFMESILEDPYLNWLIDGWKDFRSEYLKNRLNLALSQNANIPNLKNGAYQIEDYFDLHLRTEGPMKLHPYLVVLRIMRDHDPNLNEPSNSVGYVQQTYASVRNKINKILELQKILYILNRDILKLKDYRFGSEKLWNQVGSVKEALAEFHYLKRNIRRLYSHRFSRMDYETLVMQQRLLPSMTYEDFLVSQFVNHQLIEELDLVQRYRIVKNIIRLVTASQSSDELKEVMASQIGMEHFLY